MKQINEMTTGDVLTIGFITIRREAFGFVVTADGRSFYSDRAQIECLLAEQAKRIAAAEESARIFRLTTPYKF